MTLIRKNSLITGTLILTAAGFITRIIGFFYRIFLSQTFGEEGMGIYQLLSPLLAISYALCISGIQTSISKYVATEQAKSSNTNCIRILISGLIITLILSCPFSYFSYTFSDYIAQNILMEVRTAPLIRIISFSIPFGAIHSCINGYYLGKKRTEIPAITQLVEQILRVTGVFLICYIINQKGLKPSLAISVVGLVIGEIGSSLLSLIILQSDLLKELQGSLLLLLTNNKEWYRSLLQMATPLCANRVCVNLFASVEMILLPIKLRMSGLTQADALEQFGVFTGMALPFVLFPSALTSSVSLILLPTISEADAMHQNDRIKKLTQKTFLFCFLLGLICCVFFLLLGQRLGELLFHSSLAGTYLLQLSFMCPLLYLSSTLSSIVNGLGKTFYTFLIQVGSLILRLIALFVLVPRIGMNGFVIGLIASQFASTITFLYVLRRQIK